MSRTHWVTWHAGALCNLRDKVLDTCNFYEHSVKGVKVWAANIQNMNETLSSKCNIVFEQYRTFTITFCKTYIHNPRRSICGELIMLHCYTGQNTWGLSTQWNYCTLNANYFCPHRMRIWQSWIENKWHQSTSWGGLDPNWKL